jgi:hypothetical protein
MQGSDNFPHKMGTEILEYKQVTVSALYSGWHEYRYYSLQLPIDLKLIIKWRELLALAIKECQDFKG